MDARHAFRTALVAAALVTVAAAAVAGTNGQTQQTLASYQLATLDGHQTTLSAYRGEVVVVNFWASWCAPCRNELAEMNRWNQSWLQRGGRVVAISVDSDPRKARRFVSDAGLTLTVLHDGPDGIAREIDLPTLPCSFLLDRNGNVVDVIRSSSPESLAGLRKQAEGLLGRAAGAAPQSAGMGGLK